MVDFRYHLVSLISVFLALAVGVVLGAGPLQGPIASGLTSQVEVLRESQARTSVEIERLRTDVADRNAWIEQSVQQVLPGTLKDRKIAIVSTEDTSAEDVEGIAKYIDVAGGVVNQRVVLTNAWYSDEMTQFRDSLAGPVATHLEGEIPAEAPAADILAQALLEIITKTNDETKLLREILADADNALLSFEADQVVSDSIIFVGSRPVVEDGETAATQAANDAGAEDDQAGKPDSQMLVAVAGMVAKAPSAGVVVGDASASDSLISLVRGQGVAVTSIDSVGTSMGHASTVISLLSADHTARAYGTASTATELVPPLPQAKAEEPQPTQTEATTGE
ncbi:copper transporter [uncultured Actinomyces sp.]|uniref:copper transporter n=1 Tax=uncultured Actinomyces sp. TaxID=249061 RepID=UPI00261FB762|nr:copper transporter [uncultured Actinomyces sp.]